MVPPTSNGIFVDEAATAEPVSGHQFEWMEYKPQSTGPNRHERRRAATMNRRKGATYTPPKSRHRK